MLIRVEQLALEWVAELLLQPAFPEDRCAWIARQAAAELESMADQPEVMTAWGFMEQLYTAYAQTVAGSGLDPGRLVAYVGTSPATVEQAERGVAEEISRLVEDGILDTELEEARAYLLGREPFRRETARQWADLLIEAGEYGVPLDDPEQRKKELETLDRHAVEEAARRHVHPAELLVTIGLPG